MTTAIEATPSRQLNITGKPRSQVASLSSSSNCSSGASRNENGRCHSFSGPMFGNTAGQISASSRVPGRPPRQQSLIAQHASQLETGHSRPSRSFSRSSWSAGVPHSTHRSRRSASCSDFGDGNMRNRKVKRWAAKTATQWDGLRRDPDLWFEDGDCLVYTYALGQSRRQASFRVPFSVLREKKCGAMFSLCFAQTTPTSAPSSSIARRVPSGYSTPTSSANTVELYIPAPDEGSLSSRESSYRWHITTRNFFAWVFDKPLVGENMGQTLVDLQERMHLFRSGRINNYHDVMQYADRLGYSRFADNPDYALAFLYYAEHYKIRDLWIDSFAHCVGMNERLSLSPEFSPVSRLTKALITRAYLEMDIHLGRVSAVLRNFLEDDFSSAYFGLSDGGRAHLDRFRSFLHSFYVEKFGYWPPPQGVTFSRALYKALYYDFKNLYNFLKDEDSSSDLSAQKPASGGICVLQNVESFDSRHNFPPLPHPMPLLPVEPSMNKTHSQRSLRALALGSKQEKTKSAKYLTASAALLAATNNCDKSVTDSPLVQAYIRFERLCNLNRRQEKLPMVEGRRIRWILIYGIYQYLISGTRAPKEVRNPDEPEYPLCCLISDQIPWQIGTRASTTATPAPVNVPEAINSYLSETGYNSAGNTTPQIQPDCQSDDYFAHTNRDATATLSRAVSVEMPAPLRLNTSLSRVTSGRSMRRLSLSSRSSRRNSLSKTTPQAFCEILVQGYGNGLNEAVVDPPSQTISRSGSISSSVALSGASCASSTTEVPIAKTQSSLFDLTPHMAKRPSKLSIKCDDLDREASRTPCIDSHQMDELVSPVRTSGVPSSSDSLSSMDSPPWSDGGSSNSSQSSTHEEPCLILAPVLHRRNSSAEAESSGLLGGNVPISSLVITTPSATPKRRMTRTNSKKVSPVTRNSHEGFRFSFENQSAGAVGFPNSSEPPTSIPDSAIGVALSHSPSFTAPAPPPPAISSLSFETRPVVKKKISRPLSYIPTGASLLSGRSPPPVEPRVTSLPPLKAGGGIDIFSALSLEPNGSEKIQTPVEIPIETVQPSKTSRTARSLVQPPQIDMVKVVAEAEKARKKDRRKSFWRR